MPKPAERKIVMASNCATKQPNSKSPCEDCIHNGLTLSELIEIALYTVRKINNYPKSLGKTVENYFHLLYFDEIKAYLMMRKINNKTLAGSGNEYSPSNKRKAVSVSTHAKQISEIRTLCELFVRQQEDILMHISHNLDEMEANLCNSYADGEEN
jgi:hypothetical protein